MPFAKNVLSILRGFGNNATVCHSERRKTQAFFSAQNDRLIVCFVVYVCFREEQAPPLPKPFHSSLFTLHSSLFSPLPQNFIVFRRGDHWSPAFCTRYAFVTPHPSADKRLPPPPLGKAKSKFDIRKGFK